VQLQVHAKNLAKHLYSLTQLHIYISIILKKQVSLNSIKWWLADKILLREGGGYE